MADVYPTYTVFNDLVDLLLNLSLSLSFSPVSGAQLDARPTGDQEVAGSTPAGSATFFRGV